MAGHRFQVVLVLLALLPALSGASMETYPPLPAYHDDTAHWSRHIQRTMHLLETSTPEWPNTVRILFYGQSIMGGQWHRQVVTWLRERYPHARLEVENRALGGFSAAHLYRTAVHDLHPFYPDLMIFHVYGDHHRYEQIMFEARQRTACEIMLMSDHWRARDHVDGELNLEDWSGFYDQQVLPAVAAKYQCELVDVRWPWKQYLLENNLQSGDVLKDNVHLNAHGCWLMAQLCIRQLCHRPELQTDWSRSLVQEYRIGEDVEFVDGRLELQVEGNRIDLVSRLAGVAGLRVRVDGKPPSRHPDSYVISRSTNVIPPASWPAFEHIGHKAPLLEEDWELLITEVDDELKDIRFQVRGSKTGPDGEGSSSERFVSDSGRVVIEVDDWVIPRSYRLKGHAPEPGMIVRWRTYALGRDVYRQPITLDPGIATTVFQAGTTATHRLVLEADGVVDNLDVIRVYRPPVPAGPFEHMGLKPGEAQEDLDEISAPTPQ